MRITNRRARLGFSSPSLRTAATAALLFLTGSWALAQDTAIHGRVVDNDGYPIPGVNVVVEGTTIGTITDADGNYTLTAPQGANLLFSFIGFDDSKAVVSAGQTTYDVVMAESFSDLDEVVVVGYGTQKKKLVTGATVQVSGEDIAKLNTTSVLGALQSQTPGVMSPSPPARRETASRSTSAALAPWATPRLSTSLTEWRAETSAASTRPTLKASTC